MPLDVRAGPAVVTGGAGAIGSWLVRRLLEDAIETRVIDNLSSGRREHLGDFSHHARLQFHVADLRDLSAIAPTFQGGAMVWHLAANPDIRRGTTDPSLDFDQGTLATYHTLEAARRADVGGFAFSSSSVVYGLPSRLPTPEDYGPLLPESLYGASKLAAEAMVSGYAHSYGIRSYIFRFANIIGPAMTHGVIRDFLDKLQRDPSRLEVLGDGRQSKSYLRVEECVDGMRLAVARAHEPVNLFNLGNVDQISVKEIAEKVVQARGGRARIAYTGGDRGWVGDIPRQQLAIDRMRALGWSPQLSSHAAVDRTIAELVAPVPPS